jgi:hypothetical protein
VVLCDGFTMKLPGLSSESRVQGYEFRNNGLEYRVTGVGLRVKG